MHVSSIYVALQVNTVCKFTNFTKLKKGESIDSPFFFEISITLLFHNNKRLSIIM